MAKHFQLAITNTSLTITRNQTSIDTETALDGIYLLRTTIAADELDTAAVIGAYKNLSRVERDFRSLKTIDLDLRPIHHHLDDRVRAHVLICFLAAYLTWHLRHAVAPLTFTDENPPPEQIPSHPPSDHPARTAKPPTKPPQTATSHAPTRACSHTSHPDPQRHPLRHPRTHRGDPEHPHRHPTPRLRPPRSPDPAHPHLRPPSTEHPPRKHPNPQVNHKKHPPKPLTRPSGGAGWDPLSGTKIDDGWGDYAHVMMLLNNGDEVILLTVDSSGTMRPHCYTHGLGWRPDLDTPLPGNWSGFTRLIATTSTIFGVKEDGNLYWYRPTWTVSPLVWSMAPNWGNQIGTGWDGLEQLVVGGLFEPALQYGPTLMGIDPTGSLRWYKYWGNGSGAGIDWDRNSGNVISGSW